MFNSQLGRISAALVQDTPNDVIDDTIEETAQPSSSFIWNICAATRQGKIRSENQDAFITVEHADHHSLGVFDGVGGVEGGREASSGAAQFFKDYMESTEDLDLTALERLEAAIDYIRAGFEVKELKGLTTAIIALLIEDRLYYATLGDGNFAIIWPDGMIQQVLVPHHERGLPSNIISAQIGGGCEIAPRIGMIRLEADCTIMLLSDGAGDLYPYDDYADKRDVYGRIFLEKVETNLADHFLEQIEAARDPKTGAYYHNDNMSLVMAHLATSSDGGADA